MSSNDSESSLTHNVSSEVPFWNETKGLDEYMSDEELAAVPLFLNYPEALLTFAIACCTLYIIIGIPGNIITIVALSKYRKVRNATAIFIINLSVADLLFTITVLPLSIVLFANKSWVAGRVMCRLFPALNYSLAAASLFSITAITVNRYIMVAHPMHYPRLFQTKNLIFMIIFIWVFSIGLVVPILTESWGRFSLDPTARTCSIISDKNGNSPKVALIAVGLVIPVILMIACYSRIMLIVQRSRSKSTSRPKMAISSEIRKKDVSKDSTSSSEHNSKNVEESNANAITKFKNTFRFRQRQLSNGPTKKDRRLHTMIAAVLLSFFVCHVPIMIAKILSKEFSVGPYGNMLSNLVLYLTVCSNPLIYVVMSKDYRKAYKSIFK